MTSWLYLSTKELYVPLSNPSKDVINILCLCRNFCKSISFVRREFAFLSVPRYILCFLSLSRHVNFVNKKPYQGIIEILLKSFSIESFNSYRFIRLAGVLTFNIVYCFLKSCFDWLSLKRKNFDRIAAWRACYAIGATARLARLNIMPYSPPTSASQSSEL